MHAYRHGLLRATGNRVPGLPLAVDCTRSDSKSEEPVQRPSGIHAAQAARGRNSRGGAGSSHRVVAVATDMGTTSSTPYQREKEPRQLEHGRRHGFVTRCDAQTALRTLGRLHRSLMFVLDTSPTGISLPRSPTGTGTGTERYLKGMTRERGTQSPSPRQASFSARLSESTKSFRRSGRLPVVRRPSEFHVPVSSVCTFLNHHGVATSKQENPAVFEELLKLQRIPGAHEGYLSVREFLTPGAIASVVGRALLMQLAVPDLKELAESLITMMTKLEPEVCPPTASAMLLSLIRNFQCIMTQRRLQVSLAVNFNRCQYFPQPIQSPACVVLSAGV